MTEKLNADKMVMPYGPLHDQLLLSVKNDGNKITFTFDVSVSKNDYSDELFNKYGAFSKCDMIIELKKDALIDIAFETAVNYKTNKYQGLELNEKKFTEYMNCCERAEFLDCMVGETMFTVNISLMKFTSKYRKLKKYSSCRASFEYESVSWNWY